MVTFENIAHLWLRKPVFSSYWGFKSCWSIWTHSLVYTKENLNTSNSQTKLEECIFFAVFKEVSAIALGVYGTAMHWFGSTLAKDLKCKKYSPSGAFCCMTSEDVPEFTESIRFQAKYTGFLPRNPIICLIYLVSDVFKTWSNCNPTAHRKKELSLVPAPAPTHKWLKCHVWAHRNPLAVLNETEASNVSRKLLGTSL